MTDAATDVPPARWRGHTHCSRKTLPWTREALLRLATLQPATAIAPGGAPYIWLAVAVVAAGLGFLLSRAKRPAARRGASAPPKTRSTSSPCSPSACWVPSCCAASVRPVSRGR